VISGQVALLMDLRGIPDQEYRFHGAVLIRPDAIPEHVAGIPRDRQILLVCTWQCEATSVRVAHWLKDRGFDAYAVGGGVLALLGRPTLQVAAGPERRSPWKSAVAALRHKVYRRYFAGLMLSRTGSWIEAGAFGRPGLAVGGPAPQGPGGGPPVLSPESPPCPGKKGGRGRGPRAPGFSPASQSGTGTPSTSTEPAAPGTR